METTQPKIFLTRQEACERSGLSLSTIARMLRDGDLTRYRVNRSADGTVIRIDQAELDKLTSVPEGVVE